MRLSFEFYPPATTEQQTALHATVRQLSGFNPVFYSVTYGAGGSAGDRSIDALKLLKTEFPSYAFAAHLTCAGAPRLKVNEVAKRFYTIGITHIVAVRGDPPKGQQEYRPHGHGYRYARDLVEGLAKLRPFQISVAAHPEGHIQSPSMHFDLNILKSKQDAGATAALTQAFYDADVYLRFRDQAVRHGITMPIIPAILPIWSLRGTLAFAAQNKVSVPSRVISRLGALAPASPEHMAAAAQIGGEIVGKLAQNGVDHIHFYTMNKPALPMAIAAQTLG